MLPQLASHLADSQLTTSYIPTNKTDGMRGYSLLKSIFFQTLDSLCTETTVFKTPQLFGLITLSSKWDVKQTLTTLDTFCDRF